MLRSFFINIVFFICLCMNASGLLALDCRDLFIYTEELNSSLLAQGTMYKYLSQISSPFYRFVDGRADSMDSNSFVQYDRYRGGHGYPYPAVKVDLVLNHNEGGVVSKKVDALINSSFSMIMVLDGSIERDLIKEISYHGDILEISEIEYREDKIIYLLSSKKSLEVDDDYKDQQEGKEEVKTLQEFLSLYNIPTNEDGVLEFLFPPVQSVVALRTYSNNEIFHDVKKFEQNEDVWLRLFNFLLYDFRSENVHHHYEKTIKISKNPRYDGFKQIIKNALFQELAYMYLDSPYYKWAFVKDPEEASEIFKRISNSSLEVSSRWSRFMREFTEVLNSESIFKLRESFPKEILKLRENSSAIDWSYSWEDFVVGVDDKIEELARILVEGNICINKNVSAYLIANAFKLGYGFSSFGPSENATMKQYLENYTDILQKIDKDMIREFKEGKELVRFVVFEEIKLLLKKIICLYTIALPHPEDKKEPEDEDFLSGMLDLSFYKKFHNYGGCTATVVSDNTVITASHCLENIGSTGIVQVHVPGRGVYTAEAYYKNPKYRPKQIRSPEYDVALIRFPDGSFEGMYHSKINLSSYDNNEVVAVSTQGKSCKRKVFIERSVKDDESEIMDESLRNLGEYHSYETILPGDSGSPIFNRDTSIVGLLHSGSNRYAMLAYNKDFIEEVIRIDSKVKIKGVNLD